MKKTLLVASLLAGLTGIANAQNSVTLYGIVDIGYTYTKTDGQSSRHGLDSGNVNESRFGFMGQESLGNGLVGKFNLEAGFDADNGNQSDSLFGRQAWLGLAGGFGEVRLGRLDTATGNTFYAVDPFEGVWSHANFGNVFVAADNTPTNNSIYYETPNFSGFKAYTSFSLNPTSDEVAGSDNNTNQWSLAATYENGPLMVAASYDYVDYEKSAGVSDADFWGLGATYNFDVAKLHLAYARNDAMGQSIFDAATPTYDAVTGLRNGTVEEKSDAWLVGVSAPIGSRGNLMASYYTAPDWDIDAFNIGYSHGLSKRTDVYGMYTHAQNLMTGVNADTASRAKVEGDDIKTNFFSVGIRHKF